MFLDCRSGVFSSENRQIDVGKWDAIIPKTENFFATFFQHLRNEDKILKIFKKKMILIAGILEITDLENHG